MITCRDHYPRQIPRIFAKQYWLITNTLAVYIILTTTSTLGEWANKQIHTSRNWDQVASRTVRRKFRNWGSLLLKLKEDCSPYFWLIMLAVEEPKFAFKAKPSQMSSKTSRSVYPGCWRLRIQPRSCNRRISEICPIWELWADPAPSVTNLSYLVELDKQRRSFWLFLLFCNKETIWHPIIVYCLSDILDTN